jgi:hypothetical protein
MTRPGPKKNLAASVRDRLLQLAHARKDIDLLGSGSPDLSRLQQIFRDVCLVSVDDDGVVFDAISVTAIRIKEDADCERDPTPLAWRSLVRGFECGHPCEGSGGMGMRWP